VLVMKEEGRRKREEGRRIKSYIARVLFMAILCLR